MAKRFINAIPRILPPDVEVQQFAKELYNYLWIRFRVAVPGRLQMWSAQVNPIFTEAIGIAVLCEQLLMRRVVLKDVFVEWSLVISNDPTSAHMFCHALHRNGSTWSYCKRFFRCCAVIAEFYLFRSILVEGAELSKAELVFKVVFDDFFKVGWGNCGGWRGLDKFARERINPLYNRFEAYVNNLTDPLDYYPPVIERLPDAYEVPRIFGIVPENYDLRSEIKMAFSGLLYLFSVRNVRAAEEAANQLLRISLNEDDNSLPRFEPIQRENENVRGASSFTNPFLKDADKVTDMELDIRTEDKSTNKTTSAFEFVSNVPKEGDSTFSPITKAMPSSSLSQASGSTPIHKPKPRKSSESSSSEVGSDDTSVTDGQNKDLTQQPLNPCLPKTSGQSFKKQPRKPSRGSTKRVRSSVPIEELPYSSRKRTMSPESSDEDDGPKKSKK